MAFFGVTLEKIETVRSHPNADKLDICTLRDMSFQFVTAKGMYKPGDNVYYFPVDSLIPNEVQKILGVEGKLSGGYRDENGKKIVNRVKTIKLRGEISQGIVCPTKALSQFGMLKQDMTEILGVEKYEPAPVVVKNAYLMPLPTGVSTYDIEGADRYPLAAKQMMDLQVVITEKLEGMNFSVTYDGKETFVNQSNFTIKIKEGEKHSFWEVAEKQGIIDLSKKIYEYAGNMVTIYGEFIGNNVQGNLYGLKNHEVRIFDIATPRGFVDFYMFKPLVKDHKTVPIIAEDVMLKDWLNGRTIQEASNGQSMLKDTMREGIVIKPMIEQNSEQLGGRLIIKQRSPEYLAKTKN